MVHAYHCHFGRRGDEIDERVAVDLYAKVWCVRPTPGQAGLTCIIRIKERRVRAGDVSLRPALQVEIVPSEIIIEHAGAELGSVQAEEVRAASPDVDGVSLARGRASQGFVDVPLVDGDRVVCSGG